jgi:hypothetical protein
MIHPVFFALFIYTAGALAVAPIRLQDGLFSGEAVAASGAKVYFGMEKIDHSNIEQWRSYTEAAARLSGSRDILVQLVRETTAKSFPKYSDVIHNRTGFSAYEYDTFMRHVQESRLYEPAKLKAVESVSDGASVEYNEGDWIAYVSKRPVIGKSDFVHGFRKGARTQFSLRDLVFHFGTLIMSVKVEERGKKPYTHHRGVFKNPAAFADPHKTYAGISTMLHGFGASVAFRFFRDNTYSKQYLVVSPLPAMAKILRDEVKPGTMFRGTNKDKLEYALFPPIIYVHGNSVMIAQAGTDLSKYPESLPDELVSYRGDMQHDNVLVGGATDDEAVYVIKINAIARAYEQ